MNAIIAALMKMIIHLITFSIYSTLYCAKGNYEFGVTRVMKSLEPYKKKVSIISMVDNVTINNILLYCINSLVWYSCHYNYYIHYVAWYGRQCCQYIYYCMCLLIAWY